MKIDYSFKANVTVKYLNDKIESFNKFTIGLNENKDVCLYFDSVKDAVELQNNIKEIDNTQSDHIIIHPIKQKQITIKKTSFISRDSWQNLLNVLKKIKDDEISDLQFQEYTKQFSVSSLSSTSTPLNSFSSLSMAKSKTSTVVNSYSNSSSNNNNNNRELVESIESSPDDIPQQQQQQQPKKTLLGDKYKHLNEQSIAPMQISNKFYVAPKLKSNGIKFGDYPYKTKPPPLSLKPPQPIIVPPKPKPEEKKDSEQEVEPVKKKIKATVDMESVHEKFAKLKTPEVQQRILEKRSLNSNDTNTISKVLAQEIDESPSPPPPIPFSNITTTYKASATKEKPDLPKDAIDFDNIGFDIYAEEERDFQKALENSAKEYKAKQEEEEDFSWLTESEKDDQKVLIESSTSKRKYNDISNSSKYSPPITSYFPVVSTGSKYQQYDFTVDTENGKYIHKGLKNLGNTCYMNAILQSILGIDDLIEMMRSKDIQKYLYKTGVLYQTLMDISVNIHKPDSPGSSSLVLNERKDCDAKKFKEVFDTKNPYFKGYQQHDSHEFLVSLLDILERELKFQLDKENQLRKQQILEKQKNTTAEQQQEEELQDKEILDLIKRESNDPHLLNLIKKEERKVNLQNKTNGKKPSPPPQPSININGNGNGIHSTSDEDKVENEDIELINVDEFLQQKCPIEKFKSTLNIAIKCCDCKYTTYNKEIFTNISLNLPKKQLISLKTSDLQELIDNFFKEEEIIERKCEKCNHGKSVITKSLQKPPPILILHLKRFQFGQISYRKDNTPIKPLHELNLSNYLKDIPIENNNNNNNSNIDQKITTTITTNNNVNHINGNGVGKKVKIYTLHSIVQHMGSIDSGHYTCYMNVKNHWKLFDDSYVRNVTREDVFNIKSGYLFFYLINDVIST
ncbi:peptidase C19 family protein [Tieghemostelium lacteum]|uniref:Ubiquitin carboxyl-terminal hydrolase n=1 Tax=Tieghemostelium lacteum TaxID=361077 RepID=A0A152A8F1_TIELA|nr:peptidase C19 family protein [Tieghemostelium lacteum]|eukprot:KYR02520.1 peptidase C19 family protein [Tieghemostelium lacteum]